MDIKETRMSKSRRSLPVLAALLLMFTPAAAQNASQQQAAGGEDVSRAVEAALRGISGREIEAHVDFLASDHLQGRGTGQLGGEIAADYIAAQFQIMGLGAPVPTAAKTTSYFQDVPLVGVSLDPNQSIVAFSNDTETFNPKYLDEAVYWTQAQQELAEASGPVVFVGYGIVAPQFAWDDFKDVDVTGKIVVMLVNDPPSEDPNFFGAPGARSRTTRPSIRRDRRR
jgi:hypothetical protein